MSWQEFPGGVQQPCKRADSLELLLDCLPALIEGLAALSIGLLSSGCCDLLDQCLLFFGGVVFVIEIVAAVDSAEARGSEGIGRDEVVV